MNISLYIHIPFCAKKCNYCDFYSVEYSEEAAGKFVAALCREWELVSSSLGLKDVEVRTIFFGGGTPSILSVKAWEAIRKSLVQLFRLTANIEWTIECNPDSFTEEKAELWHKMGVTRLTFGVQSLNNDELHSLGRIHTAEQAIRVLESPTLSNFRSLGIDLMYGLPVQTVESFDATLTTALLQPVVSHLSAYELTVCKDTPFGRIENLRLPDEDAVVSMARLLFRRCRDSGFDRYEISNFARENHRCSHNEAYWSHAPYVGLGPGAHSYVNNRRWANISNIKHYFAKLANNELPVDFEETIGPAQLASEMILLRLRTSDGLNEDTFVEMTGEIFYSLQRQQVLDNAISNGWVAYRKPSWALTENGMLLSDAIIRQLA
jgi:oxygen-independent coproporphyrinogen-3 oxidase